MCSVTFPAIEAPANDEFSKSFDVLMTHEHEHEHDPQPQEGETPCVTPSQP